MGSGDSLADNLAIQVQLFELFEPVMVREELELVAVELLQSHGRTTIRVSIDDVGGVNLDACTRVSHVLSALLDVEDVFKGAYALEVSSPGLERPIQRVTDYERFSGYRARIRLVPDLGGRRRFTGTLGGLEDRNVVLEGQDDRHLLALDDIEKAHLILNLEDLADITRSSEMEARGESA